MKMIWHNNEFIHHNRIKMLWNIQQMALRNQPTLIYVHGSVNKFTKQMLPVMRAKGDKIGALN